MAAEGDIFSGCNMGLLQYKLGVLVQLGKYKLLMISTDKLFEAVQAVADMSDAEISINWLH